MNAKKIEENNKMEKARNLLKKIWNTKGTFHAIKGIMKHRNSMNLTEAEEIEKRQE